jgi:hypothetical protein
MFAWGVLVGELLQVIREDDGGCLSLHERDRIARSTKWRAWGQQRPAPQKALATSLAERHAQLGFE